MPTPSILDAPDEQEQPSRPETSPYYELLLDCQACRTRQSMSPQSLWRFPGILRVIGLLFIIPSVLGLGMAVLSLVSSFATSASMMNAAGPRGQDMSGIAGLGFLMGFGFSVAIAAWSLLAGTIGWIFWMNRKVWKCVRCGHFIDRD